MAARVAWLNVAPIRGTALTARDEIRLETWGVVENRRFYLVDTNGRRFTLTRSGVLARAEAAYDPETERLTVRFDGDGTIDGTIELGDAIETDFYGPRRVTGRVVVGPWADAFSQLAGRRLRLVKLDRPGQAHVPGTAASLVSEESLAELARHAGAERVDGRRFRMLIGLEGVERPHAEDDLVGRRFRVGEALLEGTDFDARCMIPTRNPDTGEVDLDTLRLIKEYRGLREGDVDFGIYAAVIEPGRVRVGDPVASI
jgi:uncharacterized protein YcbX